MRILGLDLSLTASGYCILDTEKNSIDHGIIKSTSKDIERLADIHDEITKILFKSYLNLVVVEGYSMGSRGRAFSIGELGGLIKYVIWNDAYTAILVPPKTLKKFITNNGNSPKDVMMLKTYTKYGKEFNDNNECDAFCLTQIGKAFLLGTDIQYEKDCLEKIEQFS